MMLVVARISLLQVQAQCFTLRKVRETLLPLGITVEVVDGREICIAEQLE